MVQLQIISKVLQTSDTTILEDNLITQDHFIGYEKEYDFIMSHKERYGNVPDVATFLDKFPDIELVEVTESDQYLVDTIREEYLYSKSVPVLQTYAKILKTNSNEAAEYLNQQMAMLQPSYTIGGVDIVAQSQLRYEEYKDKRDNQDKWFFESGFEELDEIIHGIQRTEEFLVIVARINQGKSWVLNKIASHVWKTGYNVGFISPEMSASSIGYRFDTLVSGFSNRTLMWGNPTEHEAQYADYIDTIANSDHKFIVAIPKDFDKKITITKLRAFIKQHQLDALFIDGITYLFDERKERGDNKTTELTHISEDLINLSIEMNVPIVAVVQANRSAATSPNSDVEGTPELDQIKDSDGIGANATKVLAIRQLQNGVLEMGIKKSRFGKVGGKLKYTWNIDVGEFVFIPSFDDAQPTEKTEKKVKEIRKQYNDSADVF